MSESKKTKEESKEEEEEEEEEEEAEETGGRGEGKGGGSETLKIEQISLPEGDGGERGGDGDEPSTPKSDKHKIDVLLKATGNAPIMKKKKWAVDQEKRISGVIEFIKKYLRLEPSENLFLYVNQAFAPSPDQTIKNLYECFGADGKLVLHYCKSQAWG